MHLVEISQTMNYNARRLAGILLKLSGPNSADSDLEDLRQVWYDLDVLSKDLEATLRRTESPQWKIQNEKRTPTGTIVMEA